MKEKVSDVSSKVTKTVVSTVHKAALAVLGSERLRILASGLRTLPAVGPVVADFLAANGLPPKTRPWSERADGEPAGTWPHQESCCQPEAPTTSEIDRTAQAYGPHDVSTLAQRQPMESKPDVEPTKPVGGADTVAAPAGRRQRHRQGKDARQSGPTLADLGLTPATVAEPAASVEPLEEITGEVAGDSTDIDPGVRRQEEAPAAWDPDDFVVAPEPGRTRFHDLPLGAPILHAIHDLGFQFCTPIQALSLPHTLQGRDIAGKAQTGTGKTAAFLLTIFQRLLDDPTDASRKRGMPRALVLAPTRELALQIEKDARGLGKYVPHRIVTVFGGMDYGKQQSLLQDHQVDILVATPGRLLDFRRRRVVALDKVEVLVIDEADRMLDMGFIPDVTNIVASCPPKDQRQTLFFGATLTPEVTRLANRWTRDAVTVEVAPEQVASANIEQVVYLTTMRERLPLLLNLILGQNLERVIVFANRRDEARRLKERLEEWGLSCALLSGDVEQSRRIKALERFRDGSVRVMVATDVAARGLHVEGISHVINFSLPIDPEDYVHRIGRTGRAGASGISVSFATEEDGFQIPNIEEFLGRSLHCQHPEDQWLVLPEKPKGVKVVRDPDETMRAPEPGGRSGSRSSGGRPGGRRTGSDRPAGERRRPPKS